jgi:uncharacterized protein YndB with AHSA1/START domain
MEDFDLLRFQAELASAGLELGTPLPLSRAIAAPAADVWKVISTPGQLHKYHPYCKANEVVRWPGPGSRDGVTYHSGFYMQRDFMSWFEGIGYDLQIGPPPRKSSWISWRIRPTGEGTSELSIQVTPILESHLPAATRQAYEVTFFGKVIETYLDHLLRGAEHFVLTGDPVQPRQFGAHSIYSP